MPRRSHRTQATTSPLMTWEEAVEGATVEANLTASEVLLLSCVRRVTARRARHQHFLPPTRDRHARGGGGGGGARSLTRSRARSVALAMAVAVAVGYAARHAYQAPFVTHAHARVITARRAPHQHFPSPRARSACARCGGGGAHLLTRLRARGVAVAMAVAMVVGYVSRHAHHARRVSRARAMSSLRVA